jgi:hypothetical protein
MKIFLNTSNWDKPKLEITSKCKICKKQFKGFGNNAEPVKKGKCCNSCNDLYVIPERLKQILK